MTMFSPTSMRCWFTVSRTSRGFTMHESGQLTWAQPTPSGQQRTEQVARDAAFESVADQMVLDAVGALYPPPIAGPFDHSLTATAAPRSSTEWVETRVRGLSRRNPRRRRQFDGFGLAHGRRGVRVNRRRTRHPHALHADQPRGRAVNSSRTERTDRRRGRRPSAGPTEQRLRAVGSTVLYATRGDTGRVSASPVQAVQCSESHSVKTARSSAPRPGSTNTRQRGIHSPTSPPESRASTIESMS